MEGPGQGRGWEWGAVAPILEWARVRLGHARQVCMASRLVPEVRMAYVVCDLGLCNGGKLARAPPC